MSGALIHGGRDELEALFGDLADELAERGVSQEVLMVGGSWLLWFGDREATRDVDSAKHLTLEASAAVARVASRRDLDADWLNDRAQAFVPAAFDIGSCEVAFEREHLRVLVPPPETIFVMKLYRASPQDVEDMALLWRRCSFTSPEDAVEQFEVSYPHAPEDPYLANLVRDIVERGPAEAGD